MRREYAPLSPYIQYATQSGLYLCRYPAICNFHCFGDNRSERSGEFVLFSGSGLLRDIICQVNQVQLSSRRVSYIGQTHMVAEIPSLRHFSHVCTVSLAALRWNNTPPISKCKDKMNALRYACYTLLCIIQIG